jgi:quinol monooxygenase YgiN
MTLIVAGTVRVPPQNVDALRPHMLAMMTATRAEDGCETYGYAEDVAEPGLIHIFEIWRDQDALAAHARAAHMAAWRAAGAGLGVSDRRIVAYEVASQRPL